MFYICNSAKKKKEEEKKLTLCWTWPVKIETFIKTFFICDAEPPPVVQMYNNHDSFKVWKLKFLKFKPHWKPKGEMFLVTFYSYFDRLSKTKKKKKKERERDPESRQSEKNRRRYWSERSSKGKAKVKGREAVSFSGANHTRVGY